MNLHSLARRAVDKTKINYVRLNGRRLSFKGITLNESTLSTRDVLLISTMKPASRCINCISFMMKDICLICFHTILNGLIDFTHFNKILCSQRQSQIPLNVTALE